MDLIVRPASSDDGAALELIAAEAGLTFNAERDLARPSGIVLVAASAERIVGFVSLQLAADEAEILDLGVIPARKRQGIGRWLVARAADAARARGIVQVFLEVRRSNGPAIALYRAVGFLEVGERKHYYRDGEDALLFRTLLESTA